MKPRAPLPEGPYLVVGLARSGVSAALQLVECGKEVIGCDLGSPTGLGRLQAAGVELNLDTEGVDLLPRVKTVIKSPGVPQQAPVITAAREQDLPVLGELELGWRMLDNEFIAVTGTNGKTTTTELIGHIYREAAEPVAVCGNVGTPVTALVGEIEQAVTVVCEASSFQLEDSDQFSPEGAVLLNITPDHLDRHPDFASYRTAKLRAFARQGNDDVAVAPESFVAEDLGGCARRIYFGTGPDAELADRAGYLWWDDQPVVAVEQLALRGTHNRENAMAAAAITLARGISAEAVGQGLKTFPSVEHRLEEIATHAGVLYVNDSKATNIDSTRKALESFSTGVRLILGGQSKGSSFSGLSELISERCRAVYLIGDAATEIEADLAGVEAKLVRSGTLEDAVKAAAENATAGEVVLLSPACASFDQFSSYEERGKRFRQLVEELSDDS